MKRPRVCVIGMSTGTPEDTLRGTALQRAVSDAAELASLADADIVQALSPAALETLDADVLVGKRILVHLDGGAAQTLLASAQALAARRHVNAWVVHSRADAHACAMLGRTHAVVPVPIDLDAFCPAGHGLERKTVRQALGCGEDAFLIAASAPGDAHREDAREHAVLDAILEQLRPVPRVHVAFIGSPSAAIGLRSSVLRAPNVEPLNELYQVADVYLAWRRRDMSLLLAALATGCRIVAPADGLATEIHDGAALYASAPDALHALLANVPVGARPAGNVRAHLRTTHGRDAVATALRAIYETVSMQPPYTGQASAARLSVVRTRIARVTRRVHQIVRRPERGLTVSLWHHFVPPPYGGGNQFMIALGRALERRGMRVLRNAVCGVDVHVLQGIGFNVPRFLRHFRLAPTPVVHRIDGPVHLYRGFDRDKDEAVFRLNAAVASATVVQSLWSLERTLEMGYHPVDPVLVPNAADPDIFRSRERRVLPAGRKIRLISSAWSDNPRKGGAIYRFLDEHLDWSRFEYTFLGRTAEAFRNIRVVPPVASEGVAAYLRDHDIYVTASRNDPCSNALVEALTCGLPALYAASGGHPELVAPGGVAFRDESDVLAALGQLVTDYDVYARLVAPPTMADVAERYATLIIAVQGAKWIRQPPLDARALAPALEAVP